MALALARSDNSSKADSTIEALKNTTYDEFSNMRQWTYVGCLILFLKNNCLLYILFT